MLFASVVCIVSFCHVVVVVVICEGVITVSWMPLSSIFSWGGYPQQTVVVIIIGVVVTPSWLSFVVVVFL